MAHRAGLALGMLLVSGCVTGPDQTVRGTGTYHLQVVSLDGDGTSTLSGPATFALTSTSLTLAFWDGPSKQQSRIELSRSPAVSVPGTWSVTGDGRVTDAFVEHDNYVVGAGGGTITFNVLSTVEVSGAFDYAGPSISAPGKLLRLRATFSAAPAER